MNNAIFILFDKNYFRYAKTFLNSVKKNWPNHPKIVCNYYDLTEEQTNMLKTYSNVYLNKIYQLKEYEKNAIGYFKLRLWSEEFNEYDNILYLDVDTLVLKPLDELFLKEEFTIFKDPTPLLFKNSDNDLKKFLSEDGILEKLKNINIFLQNPIMTIYLKYPYPLDKLDKNLTTPIGNSGVWLIPKNIRNEKNYKTMLYIFNRYKKYDWWPDQSTINLWMLKHNITPKDDIQYNFLSIMFNKIDYNMEDLKLVHFVMKKPDEPTFLEWKFIDPSETRTMLKDLYNYYENLY